MNPRNDEAILQQHYGDESGMVGHIEAYHNHQAAYSLRYQDYWNRRSMNDWDARPGATKWQDPNDSAGIKREYKSPERK